MGGPKGTEGHGVEFTSLVIAYRGQLGYRGLRQPHPPQLVAMARSHRHLFQRLQIERFDDLERMRRAIRSWRGKWAAQAADGHYGMQVLSRVLALGVDPMGVLNHNACEGIKRLYSSDRSEII